MKIVRIGENTNISFNRNGEVSKEKGKDSVKRADEIVVRLKSQDFPNVIRKEMDEIQKDVSITQAKIDAISQISKLLKGVSEYDDNLRQKIQEVYENSKYEGNYLLEDIKDDLFSGDLERVLIALEKGVDKLSNKVVENQKRTNALLVKFENISTFIENISNEQVENVGKLIVSSMGKTQKILNITPEDVIKFLSN